MRIFHWINADDWKVGFICNFHYHVMLLLLKRLFLKKTFYTFSEGSSTKFAQICKCNFKTVKTRESWHSQRCECEPCILPFSFRLLAEAEKTPQKDSRVGRANHTPAYTDTEARAHIQPLWMRDTPRRRGKQRKEGTVERKERKRARERERELILGCRTPNTVR